MFKNPFWPRKKPANREPMIGKFKRRRALRRPIGEHLESRHLMAVSILPQQLATAQDTAFTISQSQLLAGDVDGQLALVASRPTQPAHATLVDNGDGTFKFTPDPGFSGSTSFNYSVGSTDTQTELCADNGPNGNHEDSVAVSGDIAVVGAPHHSVNSQQDQGAAYVFVRSGTGWVEQAELDRPNSLPLTARFLTIFVPLRSTATRSSSGRLASP